jgi:hypothetical protein
VKIYAETGRHRARQIAVDALVLVWVVAWTWVGVRVYDLVDSLRGPGRAVEEAGGDFAGSLERVGEGVEEVPLVGDALQAPFEAVASGGRALANAGRTQQDLVHTLALYLGIALAVIPIVYLLLKYLPDRMRWVREATAADRIRVDADDLHLFALRAVATRPLHELRRATPDPAGALAAGDYEALATVELSALGLKPEHGRRAQG